MLTFTNSAKVADTFARASTDTFGLEQTGGALKEEKKPTGKPGIKTRNHSNWSYIKTELGH